MGEFLVDATVFEDKVNSFVIKVVSTLDIDYFLLLLLLQICLALWLDHIPIYDC